MILFVDRNRGILFLRLEIVREALTKITRITREKIFNTPTWRQ